MPKVNVVDKKIILELNEIVKLQLINHCYINNIVLSELDFECLTMLGVSGEAELTEFCNFMAEKRLTKKLKKWKPNSEGSKERQPEASPQTIRNSLNKAERKNLLLKTGGGRKKISLHPDMQIQTNGNILLNYKFIRIES